LNNLPNLRQFFRRDIEIIIRVNDDAAPPEFENVYGGDPNGGAKRKDQGEDGRWRCFTRDAIRVRNDNLDISWLRDTEVDTEEHLTDPEDIAAAIIRHLRAARPHPSPAKAGRGAELHRRGRDAAVDRDGLARS
jgi:hypothetical protein